MSRITKSPALALLMTCFLGGCSAISALGGAGTPLEVFELRALVGGPVAQSRAPRDVIVELPTTGGALATDRIMIRPNPLQAQYLPDIRWSDTTPDMVQTLILRSLENTQGLRFVGRRPIGPGGDVALISEITDFHAEVTGPESARITLRLIARLVRESDAQVISTRIFTAGAEVPSTEAPALVQGFDQATTLLLGDLTRWMLGTLGVGLQTASATQ